MNLRYLLLGLVLLVLSNKNLRKLTENLFLLESHKLLIDQMLNVVRLRIFGLGPDLLAQRIQFYGG